MTNLSQLGNGIPHGDMLETVEVRLEFNRSPIPKARECSVLICSL